MKTELKSNLWPQAAESIRQCHLSLLTGDVPTSEWKEAFELLLKAIKDERKLDPSFATELTDLTESTGISYDFKDILEEYFNTLEDARDYDDVIASCEELVDMFKWDQSLPSEYMFRKGNALEKSKRFEEAEAFGKEWLEKYPTDLYAAASNVFLMLELKKYEEAEKLTEKYLRDELVCNSDNDTFFMAAYRLYEMTDNINAKQRVEKKMAEYQELLNNK